MRKINKVIRADIAQLYSWGFSACEIADYLNTPEAETKAICRDLPRPHTKWTPALDERIRVLRSEGMTYLHISQKVAFCKTAVITRFDYLIYYQQ